jgi:hypothetical protein
MAEEKKRTFEEKDGYFDLKEYDYYNGYEIVYKTRFLVTGNAMEPELKGLQIIRSHNEIPATNPYEGGYLTNEEWKRVFDKLLKAEPSRKV